MTVKYEYKHRSAKFANNGLTMIPPPSELLLQYRLMTKNKFNRLKISKLCRLKYLKVRLR